MEGSLVEAQSATLWKSPPRPNLPPPVFPPAPALVGLEGLVVVLVVGAVFDVEEWTELLTLRLVVVSWMAMMLLSSARLEKLGILKLFRRVYLGQYVSKYRHCPKLELPRRSQSVGACVCLTFDTHFTSVGCV